MLVVGANDFLGRVFVGIGRAKLHQKARHKEAGDEPDDDCPMMVEVVRKQSCPYDVENEHGDYGDDEAGQNADDRGDEKPLLDVARVGRRQIFIDKRGVPSQ